MKKSRRINVASLAETKKLGRIIGENLLPGDVVCLAGDLGAGKTTLTQSIALGAGVDADEYVTSPSFAVIHEYQGPLMIYHMDFYRLESIDDLLSMGVEEYLYGTGCCIVEWFSKFTDIIPPENLAIEINTGRGEERSYKMRSEGGLFDERIEKIATKFERLKG